MNNRELIDKIAEMLFMGNNYSTADYGGSRENFIYDCLKLADTNNPADFEQFWEAYPSKISKGQAERTWNKLKKKHKLPELSILQDAIAVAKASKKWHKDKGDYIPNPSTWLNAKGWLDEHEEYKEEQTTVGADTGEAMRRYREEGGK